jgi:hypothetical protein
MIQSLFHQESDNSVGVKDEIGTACIFIPDHTAIGQKVRFSI